MDKITKNLPFSHSLGGTIGFYRAGNLPAEPLVFLGHDRPVCGQAGGEGSHATVRLSSS